MCCIKHHGYKVCLISSIPDSNSSVETLSGKTVTKTNSAGQGTAQIDLRAFQSAPSPQSTLFIQTAWIGPTRELIEESATVK